MKYSFDAEIFKAGTHNGDTYTVADLDDMVRNHTALADKIKPPVKLGHDASRINDNQPALGWVKGLRREGEKLMATIADVPEIVYKAIKDNLYKRVSSEIFWDYKVENKTYSRVLSGVALLGAAIPAVKDLADLQAYLREQGNAPRAYTMDVNGNGEIENHRKGKTEMDEKEKKEYTDAISKAAELEAEVRAYKAKEQALAMERLKEKQAASFERFKSYVEDKVKAMVINRAAADTLLDNGKHIYSEATGLVSYETVQMFIDKLTPVQGGESATGGNAKPVNYTDVKAVMDEVHGKAMSIVNTKQKKYAEAVEAVLTDPANKALADAYKNI